MSKYTTEVRYICEHLSGLDESKGYHDVATIIANSRNKIFDFPYPIFDENYRSVLETKILKHFYTREIGDETVGLWKLRLDTKLNEIMPYYNKLYESELISFDPLRTTDMQTNNARNSEVGKNMGENINDTNLTSNSTQTDNRNINTANSNGTSKTEGRGLSDSGATHDGVNRNLYSETPQGSLTGVDEESYLTDARKNIDSYADNGHTHTINVEEGSNKNTTDSISINNGNVKNDSKNIRGMERSTNESLNSTEKYAEHVFGYSGFVPSDLIKKYRDILLNIDLLIINDLEPLFMQLW